MELSFGTSFVGTTTPDPSLQVPTETALNRLTRSLSNSWVISGIRKALVEGLTHKSLRLSGTEGVAINALKGFRGQSQCLI